MSSQRDTSGSSITVSSDDLTDDDLAVGFLGSSTITCVSEEIPIWPCDFMASAPRLQSNLMFSGSGKAGWYKTAFACCNFEDDPACNEELMAKFRTAPLVDTSSRTSKHKGPFRKNIPGTERDGPAWERDYLTMLDDYQQQAVLSMLSYMYSIQVSQSPKVAYLMPLLVKAENATHSWYGLVEKALPQFRKPRSWLKADWENKAAFMNFRAWCQQEHGVEIDDPQGLFCNGTWVFFTDGIIRCSDVEEKYEELICTLREDSEDSASCTDSASFQSESGSWTDEPYSFNKDVESYSLASADEAKVGNPIQTSADGSARPPRKVHFVATCVMLGVRLKRARQEIAVSHSEDMPRVPSHRPVIVSL